MLCKRLSLALVLSCAASCSRLDLPNPSVVRDSTGVEFGWSCEDSTLCDITSGPAADDATTCSTGAFWGRFWGRFYSVCAACPTGVGSSWGAGAGACRPLACAADADCPEIISDEATNIYECFEGLCQNEDIERFPRDALTRSDAELLCFADVPRSETTSISSPAVRTREDALASQCPDIDASCDLPPECM